MKSNKFLIDSYFWLLFITSFDLIFLENINIPSVYSVLKAVDEVYVVSLFAYTILLKLRSLRRLNILWCVLLFAIIGFVGNYYSKSTIMVSLMGLYTTVKPILLFWSFCQYEFTWEDFYRFCKKVNFLFPIIVISYILDILIPSFRSNIGIVAQSVEIRMGLRSLGGLFNRFTNGIVFALVYYIAYRYYVKSSKWKYYFSAFMVFASLKVKDIAGFCFGNVFLFFKSFKRKYIIWVSASMFTLFNLYVFLMPEHYASYFENDEDSNIARVVLSYTSLEIMKEKFPIGVGHGMFASPISRQTFSPVYYDYQIDHVYGLSFDRDGGLFMCDTFWPMIFGETGVLGTIIYLLILYICFSPFVVSFFKDTSDLRFIFPAFLFLVFLVTSVGKPVFNGPPHCFFLWGIAGIFYSLKDKLYEEEF